MAPRLGETRRSSASLATRCPGVWEGRGARCDGPSTTCRGLDCRVRAARKLGGTDRHEPRKVVNARWRTKDLTGGTEFSRMAEKGPELPG